MIWLFLLLAAATSPQPGQLKTFKDWIVGCDNGRVCHATSLMPEDGDWEQQLGLSIERGAESRAEPAITLLAEGGKEYLLRTVRGQIVRVVARSSVPDYRIDPRDLPIVIAALRTDSGLGVETGGKRVGDISLAGVSAALLHMDDQQKRIGDPSAFIRPRNRPASTVPPPPPLPVIRSAARKVAKPFVIPPATIAALRKRFECEPEEPDWPGYDATEEALDPGHVLLLLGCGAGAYNYSSVAIVATKRGNRIDAAAARYDFSPNWGEGQPMLVNAEWDAEHGLLTSFAKGRGLGDCGTFADYAWDGQRFRLVERREMDECRGSIDYITTWRAKVVRN